MSSSPLNILFLPRWYPHRFDPMPGLFIQRQAEALATEHHVVVLYVHPDPDCPSQFEIDYSEETGVIAVRVYYKIRDAEIPGLGWIFNARNFYRAHFRGLEVVGDFYPDIIHSHVLTREALIGHLLSRRYHVPHVISEHWSRYFPLNGTFKGGIRKWLTRRLVGKASAVIAVSEVLKRAMMACRLDHPNFFVVPNVVSSTSTPVKQVRRSGNRKLFLHISCFDDRAKNITGLLHAIGKIAGQRSDFQCLLVGKGPDLLAMQQLAQEIGLEEDVVRFTGLKDEVELAGLYEEADFTVLSSSYETFGTVIVESLSAGIPVISTAVGIAPEVISERNGILIPPNDPDALAEGINRMLDRCRSYDREEIRQGLGDRFAPELVRKKLVEIYHQMREDV
ncbi:MAG: glycosyltransferase [Bacteroidales bacterium]|nr:glycosyltransferase [Bacteroidales bacterium]